MNPVTFYKYQGTGNDFIMIDDRDKKFPRGDSALIQKMCDRKFGIGSDGLILLDNCSEADFELIFFNPDGSKSFCGNGSRCAVSFAQKLGITGNECSFKAIDGLHRGIIHPDGLVSISVKDVNGVEKDNIHFFIDTGSPHYIVYVNELDKLNIIGRAQTIRYSDRFKEAGTNVNFVQEGDGFIKVRTYERGVENETLSCGSGVTACALSYAVNHPGINDCLVETRGGNLKVSFISGENDTFTQVTLTGPAHFVYKGEFYA
ncbi:MAG: diaminopimelate epimerase [Bacteroidota bacterium]